MDADFFEHLKHARAGNAEALGRLLASYGAYLTILAKVQVGRRLSGKADAGDVVQETFLDAHRQFAKFRGTTEAELRQWLRRILAGQLALQLRRFLGPNRDMRLERELEVQLDQSSSALEMGLVGSQSTPSRQAVRREQATLLADALAALPDDHREVLILRHLEELTFPEVAARMNRSENATHKLWARALASLRRAMDGKA